MQTMAGTRAKFPSRQGSAKVREPRNPIGTSLGLILVQSCEIFTSEKNLTKKSADKIPGWNVPSAYQNWVL